LRQKEMLYSLPVKMPNDCAIQYKGCGKSRTMTECEMFKISQSLIYIQEKIQHY
jgi:hypothetical protein